MRFLLALIARIPLILAILSIPIEAQNSAPVNAQTRVCLLGGQVIKAMLSANSKESRSPAIVKIINLGSTVNSAHADYAPVVSADGSSLTFVSDRVGSIPRNNGQASHDIWSVILMNQAVMTGAVPINIDPTGSLGINTSKNEGTISISADGMTMVLTACLRKDGFGDCDLYISTKNSYGQWSTPRNLGPQVNSKYWDSQPTITPDGRRIYFCSNRVAPSKQLKADSLTKCIDSLQNQLRLHPETEEDMPPSEFGRRVDSVINNSHSDSLRSPDTRLLDAFYLRVTRMVASEMHLDLDSMARADREAYERDTIKLRSRIGKLFFKRDMLVHSNLDIWYTDFITRTSQWSDPIPIADLNTSSREFAPFICSDGRTLLFSSEGYPDSHGGLDFYVSYLNDDGSWMPPQNLGAPLNTPEDDAFITMSAMSDMMYFSSKRTDIEGAQGDFDLYAAVVTKECSETESQSASNTNSFELPSSTELESELHVNNGCQLSVHVTEASTISLKAYDIVGHEIATLLNNSVSKPGVYHYTLNVDSLSSGVYIFNLSVGHKSTVYKLAVSH